MNKLKTTLEMKNNANIKVTSSIKNSANMVSKLSVATLK